MRVSLFIWAILLGGMSSAASAQEPPPSQPTAADTYQRILEHAKETQRQGDLEAALAGFTALTRLGPAEVPATVQAEAMERIVSIENQRRSASPGLMERFATAYMLPIPAWIFWLVVFLGAAAAWRARVQAVPLWDKTSVSFEDLSQPRAERAERNRILTRSFVSLLQNPTPVRMSDLHMDLLPGTDQPGFGGLQAAVDMVAVENYDDRPIRVASVEFSLRDVVTVFARSFTPSPAAHLTGWLNESGDGVVAFAQLTERTKPGNNGTKPRHNKTKSRNVRTWQVQRTGPDARAQAIADLAAQILVETDKSTLTHSWRSFRSFHEAIKLRQGQDSRPGADDLTAARDHLEQAVIHDPSNWIARFNLALTLCRDGQTHIALKHFELLEYVIERAWRAMLHPHEACSQRPAFQDVVRHLEVYPECAFLILYNKAVSLATLDAGSAKSDALSILDRIARLRDGTCDFEGPYPGIAARLKDVSRTELSLYAWSAKANLIAGAAGFGAGPGVTDADALSVETLLEQIEKLCASEQEQHWRSLQTSRAVALTASARIVGSRGNATLARKRLEAALAAEPRFVEAHLLLAELLIEHRDASAEDWSRRTEGLLKRVLHLSPTCRRAAALLARLHAHPAYDRSDEGEAVVLAM